MIGKYLSITLAFVFTSAFAQDKIIVPSDLPMSVRMVKSEMHRCPKGWQLDFQKQPKWDYCHGVEMKGFLEVSEMYRDTVVYAYVRDFCNQMTHDDGTVETYRPYELSLDRINTAKLFFKMYWKTGDDKYRRAIEKFRMQFDFQPRTSEGGYWHKMVYPNQMWLDGMYMAQPFYAEYNRRFGKLREWQECIKQFKIIDKHTFDPVTGWNRHAWDEKATQRWANPTTGQSAHAWGRANGWYAMALVDVLQQMPEDIKNRGVLVEIFQRVAKQIRDKQDPKTGLWYQVLDRPGDEGNYFESSVSAMFIYTLYRGVYQGLLDESYLDAAEKGYDGFMKEFVDVQANGLVNIKKCCAVAGLGGRPYRMGDYKYYIEEAVRDNDPKAVGPFISLCIERERLAMRAQKASAVSTKNSAKSGKKGKK